MSDNHGLEWELNKPGFAAGAPTQFEWKRDKNGEPVYKSSENREEIPPSRMRDIAQFGFAWRREYPEDSAVKSDTEQTLRAEVERLKEREKELVEMYQKEVKNCESRIRLRSIAEKELAAARESVTEEMVEAAYEAWAGYKITRLDISGHGAMRAALTAALCVQEKK